MATRAGEERLAQASAGGRIGWTCVRWLQRNGGVVLTFVVLLLIWEVAARGLGMPAYLLPPPSRVYTAFSQRWAPVMSNAWVTTQVILIGYAISVVVSVPLALLFAFSRLLQNTVYPLIVLFQIVPKIALAPLFIIWFGLGMMPKLLMVFLLSFFPIIVSSISGFRSISPEIMDFTRSTGAGPWKVFRKVRLPAALPSIFIGLKVASVLAPTAAIVAEFVASDRGLGFLILQFNGDLDTAMTFATIIVLSAVGITLYYAVEMLERLLIPWHVSQDSQHAEGPRPS
jgi:NitT/TauT family transport system permease protein